MACTSRFPANTFNFLRWFAVTDGQLDDLPIQDQCPIDLSGAVTEVFPYYYGTTTDSDVSGLDPYTEGVPVNASGAGEVRIPWSGEGVRLWVWFDDTVGEKTNWRDPANVLNSGTIGQDDDLFLAPSAKSTNGRTGKFYITELATVGRPLILS